MSIDEKQTNSRNKYKTNEMRNNCPTNTAQKTKKKIEKRDPN